MKNFFSHDEGARNDPKLIKVLMRLGQAGKGVYWDLVEMLYEQDGYLMLSDCESYAFALRTENDVILSLINDFGLFESDGQKFWSNSVLRRLDLRKSKSQKAAESAQKRWKNANGMRTHSEGNANKGKEKKGKEIIVENKDNTTTSTTNAHEETSDDLAVEVDEAVDIDFTILKRKINEARKETLGAQILREKTCMGLKIKPAYYDKLVNEFYDEQIAFAQAKKPIEIHRIKDHCSNWIRTQVRLGKESRFHEEFKPVQPVNPAYPPRNGQQPTNGVVSRLKTAIPD